MLSNVFAYGTLMDPECVAALLRREVDYTDNVTLPGYRMYRFGHRFAIPDPFGLIEGRLLRDLHSDEIAWVDMYENVANGLYERRAESVFVGSEEIPCFVYVAGPATRG